MSEVLQQYPGSHTASSSQELSPQQQQALELDARLGSITGRIHRGHLEHQPSGLFGGAPLELDYSGAGPSSSALGQGFQPGMFGSQQQQQQMGDNALLMQGVIPGVPVHPESPGPSMSGQGTGQQLLMPSSMMGRQGTSKQEPVLLRMLAQTIMQQQTQLVSQFPGQGSSQQGNPQVPQWPPQQLPQQFPPELLSLQQQLQQQQPGFPFTQDFNDGSSSTSSMNSVQVPQLQSRPASVGQLIMPPMDVSSSPSSGRGARRGRSHSLGSMSRPTVQNRVAQQAQQAQRDSQGFAGQGFASMASLPSGTPGQWGQRAGLMGPPRTALPSPSPSPSPDRLPRLGHALERTIYATPPEQTPSNPAAQFGLGSQPYGGMLPDFPHPFQSHANKPWGQAVEPSSVFESQLVQQPPQEFDTEPGELSMHVVLQAWSL